MRGRGGDPNLETTINCFSRIIEVPVSHGADDLVSLSMIYKIQERVIHIARV